MTDAPAPVVAISVGADPEGSPDVPGLLGLDAATIERVVALTLARAGIAVAVELSIVVTSDEELRRLNQTYRGRDEPTDVLSFPLRDTPLARAPADQLWGGEEDAATTQANPATETMDGEHKPSAFVTPPDGPAHLGDIVIARGVASRQAALAGHAASWELAYLVAHGVLHLIGYDDHTEAGYAAMVAQQEGVLRQAGISR